MSQFPDDIFGQVIPTPDIENAHAPSVAEGAVPVSSPSSGPMPGFHDADALGVNLTAMLREGSVPDLDWLNVTEQDLDRLPQQSKATAVPELQEAWAQNQPKTAISNVDLEVARFRASLENTPAPAQVSKADLLRVARKAMRRTAAGVAVKVAVTDAAKSLGYEAHRLRPILAQLRDDEGLVGKVFIRADAYPGCDQGTWTEPVRRTARLARYVVAKPSCAGCIHNQGGRCTVFSKQVVDTVPWKEAAAAYSGALKASGRPLVGSDPKEALRASLAAPVRGMDRLEGYKPVHVPPADRISSEDARKAFEAQPIREVQKFDRTAKELAERRRDAQLKITGWVQKGLLDRAAAAQIIASDLPSWEMVKRAAALVTAVDSPAAYSGIENDLTPKQATAEEAWAAVAAVEPPKPIDISHRATDRLRAKAHERINAWVQAGLLSRAAAEKLKASAAEPQSVLKAAVQLVTAPKRAAAYSGLDNQQHVVAVTQEAAWEILRQAEAVAQERATAIAAERQRREHAASRKGRAEAQLRHRIGLVTQAIERGARGKMLLSFIKRTIPAADMSAASKVLTPILHRTGALEPKARQQRMYEGTSFERVQPEARQAAVNPKDVNRLLKWARIQMSEGFVGADLDHLLETRFAASIRKASAKALSAAREAHEGLSGHFYVDAAAYASQHGVEGCERGSLKHRTNGIKTVLAMPRCGSCVHRVVAEDGTPGCRLYRKALIDEANGPELKAAQRRNKRHTTDAEATASLFAPTYNPAEFNLVADGHIPMGDTPTHQEVGQILFGGMYLDPENS